MQGENNENEIQSKSNRLDQGLVNNVEEFRSYLNTNLSKKGGLTVETSRVINSDFSSQESRQLEELKSDLNAQALDVIVFAIAEKVFPSIENAIRLTETASNAKWDLRSNGLHQSELAHANQKRDVRSDGLHQSEFAQGTQERDPRSGGLHQSEFAHAVQKGHFR